MHPVYPIFSHFKGRYPLPAKAQTVGPLRVAGRTNGAKSSLKDHQNSSKESPPQPLRFVCSNNGRGQNQPHRPDPEQQLPPRYHPPTPPYSWQLPEPSVPVVLAQWLVSGRAWWSWSCLPLAHWSHLPQAAWELSINTTVDL